MNFTKHKKYEVGDTIYKLNVRKEQDVKDLYIQKVKVTEIRETKDGFKYIGAGDPSRLEFEIEKHSDYFLTFDEAIKYGKKRFKN